MATEGGLTLTQTAYYGRKAIKFGLIALVVLMVGRTFLGAFLSYWRATHPPAPPPPTVGFGTLPLLRFPVKTSADKPTAYQLQLPNDAFPFFGDRAKVFLMEKSSPSLLADQRVKQIAVAYGFTAAPNVLDSRTYRWTKSTPLQTTLDMDIQNMTFSLSTDYLAHPELLSQKNLPSDQRAQDLVMSFVASGQSVPSDVSTSSAQITYLKATGTDVSPAVSFSDADFLQVDIQRTPIDGIQKFYTPSGTTGVIHAVISGAFSSKDQIVQLAYKHHRIDYSEVNTYPIRTPAQAWQLLQAGEAYIAQKGRFDTAVVRTVSLGYYDDFQEQDYLQPIYVFQGDGGFLGYVPAVDSRYIQNLKSVNQSQNQ